MKKKVIGIAAGLILLAAAGGYAGVGHYYASHFFPKTAINGLNCAGLTAEQVKEEIQKHIVDYTLSITERGGKTETLSGTEIGLTYVDDHAVEKLLESQNTLAWPAFYWKEKENQVAADSVYDKEMVQEKLQTMEGFQEEQHFCRRSRTKHREISTRFTSIRPMTARQMISEIHTSRCAFPSRKCGATRMAFW